MNKPILAVWTTIAAVLAGGPVLAQNPAAPNLMAKAINAPAADNWTVFGSGESHEMVKDDTVPGRYAFTVSVPKAGEHPWDIEAGITLPIAVKKNDVLLFAFWGRAVAVADGATTIHVNGRMQDTHSPYAGIGDAALDIGTAWKLYYVSGTAPQDFVPGEAGAGLQLATGSQTVALGPLFVLDFGPGYDLNKLPKN